MNLSANITSVQVRNISIFNTHLTLIHRNFISKYENKVTINKYLQMCKLIENNLNKNKSITKLV